LIFAFFRLTHRIIPLFRFARTLTEKIIRWLPILELIAWFTFLVSGILSFQHTIPVIAGIFALLLLFLIGVIGWYSMKDFIAGLIVRSSSFIKRDYRYRIGDHTGKIRSLGLFGATMETRENELLLIPYSRIAGSDVFRHGRDQHLARTEFVLSLPDNGDIMDLRQRCEAAAYLAPNTALFEAPEIHILGREDGRVRVQFSLYLITTERREDTMEFLLKYLDGMVAG